ncbi:MAG: S1C family serine protease [candidate division Zixibacteria bacterium]|nr:S1C family serine protease [candidate division Zixibacteria bacterium]
MPILMAVFFTISAFSADSSLYSIETNLSELIYKVSRSVVTVEVSRHVQGSVLEGAANEAVYRLISSGIVVDSAGHIIVKASSVAGRERITVAFEDQTVSAKLIGIDYHTGLALLKPDHRLGTPVRLVVQQTCAGQMVIAIGNAFGMRACPSIGFCAGSRPNGSVQFSAPITSGTIGGGLFDLSGGLLGVIVGSIGQGSASEAGLAVPAHKIPSIVNYLSTRGDRVAGYIGITTADIELSPGIRVNFPNQFAGAANDQWQVVSKGTLITNVVPSSPAMKAGLRKGDLVFRVNREAIKSARELMAHVQGCKPGNIIELGFIRHNNPYYAKLRVGRRDVSFIPEPFLDYQGLPFDQKTLTDSLYREIDQLRQSLLRLENRLRHLRH